jgi:hypothetical protein
VPKSPRLSFPASFRPLPVRSLVLIDSGLYSLTPRSGLGRPEVTVGVVLVELRLSVQDLEEVAPRARVDVDIRLDVPSLVEGADAQEGEEGRGARVVAPESGAARRTPGHDLPLERFGREGCEGGFREGLGRVLDELLRFAARRVWRQRPAVRVGEAEWRTGWEVRRVAFRAGNARVCAG